MIKNHRKLLAFLLCAALLCTLAGFTVAGNAHDDHDHDHENEALNAVLASPLVTSLDFEAVPLAEGPAEGDPPAPAPTPEPTPPPCNHNWVTHYEEETWDCVYGLSGTAYDQCTICGARQSTAARPKGSWAKGQHNLLRTESNSGCPNNPNVQETCQNTSSDGLHHCTYTKFTQGGHEWDGVWKGEGADRHQNCIHCGASSVCSHSWVKHETPSTCTKHGSSYEQCSICGAVKNKNDSLPLAPHQYGDNSDDCTKARTCLVCGAVKQGNPSHSFGKTYEFDETQHWRKCTHCSYVETTAHTRASSTDCTKLGRCTVCGAPSIDSGKQHNYTIKGTTNLDYHVKRCSNPGCTASIKEAHYSARAKVCGESQWCDFCGVKMSDASGSHSFGGWTATSTGHSRTCSVCGYTQTASHTASRSGSGSCTTTVTCSTCGYVVTKGYSDHSFGVWMANGSTHYRVCTHPGCTAQQSAAHTGGKSTCTSAAVCSICGASYGSKSTTAHVGGTELRNDRPAAVGKAGYTGDTYCLGCGKKISSGTTIKALEGDHKHEYSGAWHSDSGSHWHQCACGERSDEASHSFSNGKCSVCGASDPNYKVCSGSSHVGGSVVKDAVAATKSKAGYTGDLVCTACGKLIAKGTAIPKLDEEHEHEYSVAWRIDSENHWKDCTCGEITRKGAHSYVNGVCAVCGTTDPEEADKAHAHEYGALISDGQYHWRVCTICGYQAEKTAHTVLNGSCMTCGYVLPDIAKVKDVSNKDWFYDSVKTVVEAGLLSGGKSAKENTSFKPTDKVSLADTVDALYRLAGSPIASTETKFKDVKADDYYAAAAAWVTDNNILAINGKEFDAEKPTTMEEMVTFLWRFAQTAGWKTDVKGFEAPEGADEAAAAAAEAMAWAAEQGLTEELYGDEVVTAETVVNRAEAATILAKFMTMIEENGLPEIENGVEEVTA